jgi:hypothetical protein
MMVKARCIVEYGYLIWGVRHQVLSDVLDSPTDLEMMAWPFRYQFNLGGGMPAKLRQGSDIHDENEEELRETDDTVPILGVSKTVDPRMAGQCG